MLEELPATFPSRMDTVLSAHLHLFQYQHPGLRWLYMQQVGLVLGGLTKSSASRMVSGLEDCGSADCKEPDEQMLNVHDDVLVFEGGVQNLLVALSSGAAAIYTLVKSRLMLAEGVMVMLRESCQ